MGVCACMFVWMCEEFGMLGSRSKDAQTKLEPHSPPFYPF